MHFPPGFPIESRAAVEVERQKAHKQFEQRRARVPWSRWGSSADEENLRRYILRVFVAFTEGARKLGLDGIWNVEQVREHAEEFLRRFTIEAYFSDGHDKAGGKLPEMTSNWGGILPRVMQEYRKSAEWSRYQRNLLAVAKAQSKPTWNKNEQPLDSTPQRCAEERRARVDAYIDEIFQKTGKRINRTSIWKAARYTRRTEFERWERCDPKRTNKTADEVFTRILKEKPHLK